MKSAKAPVLATSFSLYTMRCRLTGEAQTVVVCDRHASEMPHVDGDRVTAQPADNDLVCEFCTAT